MPVSGERLDLAPVCMACDVRTLAYALDLWLWPGVLERLSAVRNVPGQERHPPVAHLLSSRALTDSYLRGSLGAYMAVGSIGSSPCLGASPSASPWNIDGSSRTVDSVRGSLHPAAWWCGW